MKDLALLAIRVYFGVALLYFAEQGGIAKWNWGAQNVASNVVVGLGTPFSQAPLLFAWCVILAEFVGSISLCLGFLTEFGALMFTGNFLVAVYAHLVLWKHDIMSVIFNSANVHGAAVYAIAGLVVFMAGPGAFSLDAVLFRGSKKSKPE